MASFPVIQTTSNSSATSTTTHNVSMPSGIAAGDKLVVFFVCDGGRTVNTPTGWTKTVDLAEDSGGLLFRLVIYTKTAAGSDTISVTTSGNTDSAHAVYRYVTTGGFELATAISASISTSPNPPSLTPSGGSQKYKWISVVATRPNITAYPAGYTNNQVKNEASNFTVGVATRDNETSSEDPGVFTIASSDRWITATVALEEQEDVVGSFDIITQTSEIFQPSIDFPANATFTLISSTSQIFEPQTKVSGITRWTNTGKGNKIWSNQKK